MGLGIFRVLLRVVFIAGGGIVFYRTQHSAPVPHDLLSNISSASIDNGHIPPSDNFTRNLQEEFLFDASLPIMHSASSNFTAEEVITDMERSHLDAYLWTWVPFIYVATVAVLGASVYPFF